MAGNECMIRELNENVDLVHREGLNANIVPPTSSSIVMDIKMGPNPCRIICPHCFCRIFTNVRRKTITKTHLMCVLLSCTWCLCCLPYCMDSCRNADHYCPVCEAYVGTYHA